VEKGYSRGTGERSTFYQVNVWKRSGGKKAFQGVVLEESTKILPYKMEKKDLIFTGKKGRGGR